MRCSLQKLCSIALLFIGSALFLFFLSLLLSPSIWMDPFASTVIVIAILACYLGGFYFAHTCWRFVKSMRYFWCICFLLYAIILVYLLFFSKEFARDRIDLPSLHDYFKYIKMQWDTSVNLIPFATIRSLFAVWNTSFRSYALINLFGNLVAFTPFAFFLLLFCKKMNWLRYTLLMSALIISVEIIQFVTLTGSMDIDDYILNIIGTLCMYAILHIPILYKLMKRIRSSIHRV